MSPPEDAQIVSRYAKPVSILYFGANGHGSPSEYLSLLLLSMPRTTRIEANVTVVNVGGRTLREHLNAPENAAYFAQETDLIFLEEAVLPLSSTPATVAADAEAIAQRVHQRSPCARIVLVAPYHAEEATRALMRDRLQTAANNLRGILLPFGDIAQSANATTAPLVTYALAASLYRLITNVAPPSINIDNIAQVDAARVQTAIVNAWAQAPSAAPGWDYSVGSARAPYWCSLACTSVGDVRWVSTDLTVCNRTEPAPAANEIYFSSTCGCGYFQQ